MVLTPSVFSASAPFDVSEIPNKCTTPTDFPDLYWPLPGSPSDYDRSGKNNISYGSIINGTRTQYSNHYLLDFGVPWHNECGGDWSRSTFGEYVRDGFTKTNVEKSSKLHSGIDIVRKIDRSMLRGIDTSSSTATISGNLNPNISDQVCEASDLNDLSSPVTKQNGNDIRDARSSQGWPVYPVYPGELVVATSDPSIVGKWKGKIAIKHTTDIHGNTLATSFTTTYWHISVNSNIQVGQTVDKDTLLGHLADLENPDVYDRDHLHITIRKLAEDVEDDGVSNITVLTSNSYEYLNLNKACFEDNDKWISRPVFSDLDGLDDIYKNAIEWLWKFGIVKGYDYINFGPRTGITRAEFAKIFVLVLEDIAGRYLNSVKNLPFTDIPSELEWSKEYINKIYAEDYVDGVTATTFEPKTYLQRDQLAKIVLKGIVGETELDEANGYWALNYNNCAAKTEINLFETPSVYDDKSWWEVAATREEVALAMYRGYQAYENKTGNKAICENFDDSSSDDTEDEALELLNELFPDYEPK